MLARTARALGQDERDTTGHRMSVKSRKKGTGEYMSMSVGQYDVIEFHHRMSNAYFTVHC